MGASLSQRAVETGTDTHGGVVRGGQLADVAGVASRLHHDGVGGMERLTQFHRLTASGGLVLEFGGGELGSGVVMKRGKMWLRPRDFRILLSLATSGALR